MIIDFTISNFRSILDRQTFSMYAESSSSRLAGNVAYPGDGKFGVLKTASIYGANASGKTNLLDAFHALKYIACQSRQLEDGDFIPCYEPYLLDAGSRHKPIEFEVEFYLKNERFIYEIAYDQRKIISESLDYFPSRAKANLFKRREDDSGETMLLGSHLKGGKRRHAFFPNNSYLSKAGSSADSPEIIRKVYNYVRSNIVYFRGRFPVLFDWKHRYETVRNIGSILSKIDTGIVSVHFEKKQIEEDEFQFDQDFPAEMIPKILDDVAKEPVFTHVGKNGYQAEFKEANESSGTLRLFKMIPFLLAIFRDGDTLLVDELDAALHPHIAELIIKLFNDPTVNQNNAQLIFTTHDISLMSPDLLRRDQIWFTEKQQGETLFSSLDDFDKKTVKIDSPFDKWYGEGRLGAVPQIDIAEVSKIIRRELQDAKN